MPMSAVVELYTFRTNKSNIFICEVALSHAKMQN